MGRKRGASSRRRTEQQKLRMRDRRAVKSSVAVESDASASHGMGEPSLSEGKSPNAPRLATPLRSLSTHGMGVPPRSDSPPCVCTPPSVPPPPCGAGQTNTTDSVPTVCTSQKVPLQPCSAVVTEFETKVVRKKKESQNEIKNDLLNQTCYKIQSDTEQITQNDKQKNKTCMINQNRSYETSGKIAEIIKKQKNRGKSESAENQLQPCRGTSQNNISDLMFVKQTEPKVHKFTPLCLKSKLKMIERFKLNITKGPVDKVCEKEKLAKPNKVQPIAGDGNCFFRALSFAISNSEQNHKILRKQIVHHMLVNNNVYVSLMRSSDGSVSDYIFKKGMLHDGVWATEVEILAAADLLNTNIYIYEETSATWLEFSPKQVHGSIDVDEESIYLIHKFQSHYNVVLNVEGHKESEETFSGKKQNICYTVPSTDTQERPEGNKDKITCLNLPLAVQGHFDQSHSRFQENAGKQCVMNSLSALIYSQEKPTFSWTSHDLDQILINGNEMYTFLQRSSTMHNEFIAIHEIPRSLEYHGKIYDFTFQETVMGTLGNFGINLDELQFFTLIEALHISLLQKSDGAFITFKGSTFVVIKQNNQYCISDPHSRSLTGTVDPNGSSIVIHYSDIDDVYQHCLQLAESMAYQPDDVFEVTAVEISKENLKDSFRQTNNTIAVTSRIPTQNIDNTLMLYFQDQENRKLLKQKQSTKKAKVDTSTSLSVSSQKEYLHSYMKKMRKSSKRNILQEADRKYKMIAREKEPEKHKSIDLKSKINTSLQTNINSYKIKYTPDQSVQRKLSRNDYMKTYMQIKRQEKTFRKVEKEMQLASKQQARNDPEFRNKEKVMELTSKHKARSDAKFRNKEKVIELTSKHKARSDPKFRNKEKVIELTSKHKARSDPKFRNKERVIELTSKHKARSDPKFRNKEKVMELTSKQKARSDPKFRNKEKVIELTSKQKARESDIFRLKETQTKQDARRDPKFRNKEKVIELTSKHKARSDPKFRNKEKVMELTSKQKARCDPKFRNKEKVIELTSKQKARSDPKFRNKEKVTELTSKQKARESDIFRLKETQTKQDARSDPKFRNKEKVMELTSKHKSRNDPKFRNKEKVMELTNKQSARKKLEFRRQENILDLKRKRNARKDSFFQDCERIAKQQYRKNLCNKNIERNCDHNRKADKRKSFDFIQNEQSNVKKRKYGSNVEECIQKFHDKIKIGPIYICTCCHQTWFSQSVLNSATLKTICTQFPQFFTGIKSVDNTEWICHTCHAAIKDGRVPKLSVANGMVWPEKPKELDLHPLEERLVALRIPFMQIRELPRGGQYSTKGNVVNVPVDIQPTINALPRKMDENFTIAVKLKKRLSHISANFTENVRPTSVLAALHWLMNHSDLYKDSGIEIDENWFKDITNSAEEIVKEFTGSEQFLNNKESINCKFSEESDNFSEIAADENIMGNSDTLIEDADPDTSKVYTFAPGENQRPLSLYEDKDSEYLSFPSIFCGQRRPDNNQRKVPVPYSDIAKWELRSIDRRAARSVPNIFFKLKKIQMKQISDKVNLAVRRCKTKGKNITAAQARDPTLTNDIVKHNDGYYIFKTLRNSPAYLQARKKDLFVMIRQLGLPTWFMSLSSADTRWSDLLKILAKRNYNKDCTDQEIENMTWDERTKLLQQDPETSTEYFDHRGQQFIHSVLKSPFHPVGKITDFFHRIEFQQRGSPHIHMVVWIENAPKYQENSTEEIVDFVNSYVKCSNTSDDSDIEELIKLQVHKHSKSCRKKGKAICRFGFPLPPLPETMILEPLETDVDKYRKKYTDLQQKLNEMKEGCDLSYKDFLKQVLKMSEDEYMKCICSSLKGPKVFLKRQPSEMRVNYYNDTVLSAWKANLDIQFILDPYACAMYIVSYISKSQRGISAILDRASQEAKDGNMDLKKQVRHIGNKFLNFVEVSAQEACYLVLQLPLTRASRSVVFINTSPPEERVFLLKHKAELDNLPPDSTDIEMGNIIQRYIKRPKQLENWCLADYVSKLDIKYPKTDQDQCESNTEQLNTDCEETDDFLEEDIILTLRNGIVIKRRHNPNVIRYVHYNKKTNAENYYRERILLFLPWRSESKDLLGNCETHEEHYISKKQIIENKAKEYEHHVDELEQGRMEAEREIDDFDELVPNAQQIEAEDEEEGTNESDEFVHFNPDSIEHAQHDIGSELGMHTNVQSVIDCSPVRMPDEQYLQLLRSLNVKQREFFNHIIQWTKTKDEPVYCFLSGGAGVGKSVVVRALYQALHRQLCSVEGESPDDIRILLCAYTGKAAYNIGGSTIASSFHKKMYQSQQNMLADELNTFRTKYRNLSVVIIDEISMVGSNLLIFINERLKQLTMSGRDFGGISIIAVGDLYQLQPIGDPWIFAQPTKPGQGLATNLWKEHFKLFELTEIMRQKEDLQFAQLLNRLRHNSLTEGDMSVIQSKLTDQFASSYPKYAPHIFTENKFVNNFNSNMINTLTSTKVTVKADTDVLTHTNIKKDKKEQLLNQLPDDSTKTGQLANSLTIAVDMIYDISVNIDVDDGLTNGSTCVVKFIEFRKDSRTRPAIIWVYFSDKNIGAKRRGKSKHLYSNHIDATWTPIFETKRTFLFNRKTFERTQFPLQPSAAKTIHKAQGATLDELVIDLSQTKIRKIPHIHYVALSRVRSLQNLHILNFNEKALKVDENVVLEMERLRKDSLLNLCYKPVYMLGSNSVTFTFNNARSLHKHFPDIASDPNVTASDVIGIAESRLTVLDLDDNYLLPGYKIIRNDEFNSVDFRPHHGLVLYVKSDIHVCHVVKSHNKELEFIYAELKYSDTNMVQVVIVYKYPVCTLNKFKNHINSQLSSVLDISKKLIILGDFNFDINDGHTDFYNFMLHTFSCSQIVEKQTTNYHSKLDLIFTNMQISSSDVIEAYWSDHKIIYCAVEVEKHAK